MALTEQQKEIADKAISGLKWDLDTTERDDMYELIERFLAALPASEQKPVGYFVLCQDNKFHQFNKGEKANEIPFYTHSHDSAARIAGLEAEVASLLQVRDQQENYMENQGKRILALKEKLRVAREAVAAATLELKEMKQSIGFRHQTLVVIESCEKALATIGEDHVAD